MGALRVAVSGAGGRVGRLVLAEVLAAPDLALHAALVRGGSAAHGVDAGLLAGTGATGVVAGPVSAAALAGADVVVDFSTPRALAEVCAARGGVPLVSGTTGLDADELAALRAAAVDGPVLLAANFSTGVAVLRHLVARAAAILPDYDLEIVEVHHHHKADAPSGTAGALLQAAASARGLRASDVARHGRHGLIGARSRDEIGVHAVRAGDVVGEHAVWLAGGAERLVLSHAAHDRRMFAAGALRAARWIRGRAPGWYTMDDVLGLASV